MNFNEMNISNEIKMALQDMGFENPTPIQEAVIPLVLDKKDVIAQAPTGTGKTCAFGIPVINDIDFTINTVQALILCPTRELVIQTENELKEVAAYTKSLKIVSIYGGQNIDRQLSGLKKNPQIIIGTTGRIMDHLRRKSLKLQTLRIIILDEVDEMLNMGFREDIDVILESVPKIRQTVMFSATISKEISEISKLYQINPINIKTQQQESDIPDINQYYVKVTESEKITALSSLICDKNYGLSLVFTNTKKRAEELRDCLCKLGLAADALHGDLRQIQRDRAMQKFRNRQTQVLIATDVAARGLDVDDIEAVFNFDIPHDEEYYLHRIGRTARAKKTGAAYTFVSEKQMYIIKNFERFTKSIILKEEYSPMTTQITIDKKRFDKAVKISQKKDLSSYKDFLVAELQTIQQKYDNIELMDITAALLMQLSEAEAATATLSEPPRLTMKEPREFKRRTNSGVKFFMNIGTRDKCDEMTIKKFISGKTEIALENILDVNCLESFSFATVTDGNNSQMESLNGLKYNGRILAVEVASEKSKEERNKERSFKRDKPSGDRSFSSDKPRGARSFHSDKPRSDKSDKQSFDVDNNDKSGFRKSRSYKSDKPRAERSFKSDKLNSEPDSSTDRVSFKKSRNYNSDKSRNDRSTKPSGEKVLSSDKPQEERNFNLDKPRSKKNFKFDNPSGERNYGSKPAYNLNNPSGVRGFRSKKPGSDKKF